MSISTTFGLSLQLTNSLSRQQALLGKLSNETATGLKYNDLTEYNPTDARTVLDASASSIQRQAYISTIQTVQSRLSIYDTTLTDIENLATQSKSLATSNQSYSASTVSGIQQEVTNYLKQLTDDLNQQVSGRYIFSGARYTAAPVQDLSTLTSTVSSSTVSSPTLPSYDSDYGSQASVTINKAPTGNFTIGNVSIPWSQVTAGNVTSVTVGGVSTPVTVSGLTTPGTTTTDYAANLASTINQIASTVGLSTVSATSSLNKFSLTDSAGTSYSITPDSSGVAGETTWTSGTPYDGTINKNGTTSTTAYVNDTAVVDNNYTLTYGITSDDPSFQNLINGMRYILAACTAGKAGNTTTYSADMQQANTLLTTAISGIQSIHTQNANNQNTLASETSSQNQAISTLQDQVNSIQGADLTTLATEITRLQTQLQASYSATATLEKLSLVSYL